jgi:hypothetical protein
MGNIFFCQIAEAFFSGLTNGTSATTYSPGAFVPREQMAAFITRTQDSTLRRGARRAALKQWAPNGFRSFWVGGAQVGQFPESIESDGEDLWVANNGDGTVTRVHASDLRVLGTWTGAASAIAVLVTSRGIVVAGNTSPGSLYIIDPVGSPGAVTTLSSTLGNLPQDITTDGSNVWTANAGGLVPGSGSVSKVPSFIPANITAGFSQPVGILFDGTNVWVTDAGDNKLKKLDSDGNVLQSVGVGTTPQHPVFDGANIWVPNAGSNSVTVVRARDGMVLATLTGDTFSLNQPHRASFDGQRILVTNSGIGFASVWKATDLTQTGTIFIGGAGTGACSDGIYLWVTTFDANTGRGIVLRF